MISGIATIQPGIPPCYLSFAETSPKVLETDSLPGRTLTGGTILFPFLSLMLVFWF